jgi:glycolate oxidase iron-sulfur subunit
MSSTPFSSLEPLQPLMDKCVHCGFCLPTCPSYLLLGQEMDSPRGRIYSMRAGLQDRVGVTDSVVQHFDTCLGCMACETACPSGVKYAPLIEQTRSIVEHHHARPLSERLFRRMLFAVLPYPGRLRVLRVPLVAARLLRRSPALLRLLPAKLRNLLALAPSPTGSAGSRDVAEHTPAVGAPRARIGVVTGCVQRAFFGHVNEATVRVLAAEGCEVHAPSSQGCCGALALHAGEDDTARTFARQLIATFEQTPVDLIAINAAGCGSAMKEYGHLLRET